MSNMGLGMGYCQDDGKVLKTSYKTVGKELGILSHLFILRVHDQADTEQHLDSVLGKLIFTS